MRSLCSILLFATLFADTPPARAVIVDRVAVAVGIRVITDSEIIQRIRLTAFENDETPDFTLASRREATSRLIDQKLVEREMEVGHYPHLAADRGEQLLADLIKTTFKSDKAAFEAALLHANLTTVDLRSDLIREADLITFLDLRFRPAVEVTQEDVRKFFDQKISPKTGADAFEQMRTQIEQQLAAERSDQELTAWLNDQRKRTKIEYSEKDLEETVAPDVPAKVEEPAQK